MVDKISFPDLVSGAADGSLSEEQINVYFTLDATRTKGFDPHFRINVDKVDVDGMEKTAAVSGDALAVEAGRNHFGAKFKALSGNGTYVAEGDS